MPVNMTVDTRTHKAAKDDGRWTNSNDHPDYCPAASEYYVGKDSGGGESGIDPEKSTQFECCR